MSIMKCIVSYEMIDKNDKNNKKNNIKWEVLSYIFIFHIMVARKLNWLLAVVEQVSHFSFETFKSTLATTAS